MRQLLPDRRGRFGDYGGRYVPEVLVDVLDRLESVYEAALADPSFRRELESDLCTYAGRPTPLYRASRLSARLGGADIYLKREDLNYTGSHNLNNALGHVLLARRMGASRLIAETGSGQHGVAVAAAAARAGLPCKIFMGEHDARRNFLNVAKMEALGATLVVVDSGSGMLRDALGEAIRAWISDFDEAYFVAGTAVGPHPYPRIVRDMQRVIGAETRAQLDELGIACPSTLIACVGGGANALGLFHPFLDSPASLVGVEARGANGCEASVSPIASGTLGVLHGSRSYVSPPAPTGSYDRAQSRPSGLSYPSAGPEHAWLKDLGRVSYVAVDERGARRACALVAKTEGILPALESGYALAHAIEIGPTLPDGATIVVGLSGSGDKDICLFERSTRRA